MKPGTNGHGNVYLFYIPLAYFVVSGSLGPLAASARTPNIRRHSRISRVLEQSLFNSGQIDWVDTSAMDSSGKTYRMVDFFCGSGGISLGFKLSNFQPVLAVDIDHGACLTYRHNFPGTTVVEGRMENVDSGLVNSLVGSQPIHVLSAGFPCPGFSIAGLKNPNDPRNYLYKEVVRLVGELRPWFVVMENVPRIVTLGNFLVDIIDAFAKVGYTMSALILESAKYGVPQIRPRTIFIANRFGLKNPYPKPLLEEGKYVSIEKAIDDLKGFPSEATSSHEWTKHSKAMEERISKVPAGGSLYKSYYDAWKRQYRGVPSMTIKENHGGAHIHH